MEKDLFCYSLATDQDKDGKGNCNEFLSIHYSWGQNSIIY